jgi:hypothetical protein
MSEQSKLIHKIAVSFFGAEVGCSDSGCFYGHHGGMGTNGGCKCWHENPKLAAQRMRKIAHELARACVSKITTREDK